MSRDTIYDIVILSVEAPAFRENNTLMVQNILEAGGTCPTFIIRKGEGAAIPGTDPVEYEQVKFASTAPMVGTKAANGKIQLHFRLSEFYTEAEVLAMLTAGMVSPIPPVTVSMIGSGFKNLWIDDGLDGEGNPIGHYEYHTVIQAQKAAFLPFMDDVPDGTGGMRPPNNTDTLYLSGYSLTENVELT